MSKPTPVNGLELAQDLAFQQKSWRVQRIGWGVLALLIGAALLGLFGKGPLSQTQARTEDGLLQFQYERFLRFTSPSTLQVVLAPAAQTPAANLAITQIWFSREYLEALQLEQVTPAPTAVEVGPDRLLYTFAVSDPTQPVQITFYVKANQIGLVAGQAGLADQPPLTLRHFVYP